MAIKSEGAFPHVGFDDNGFARTILLVEPTPFLGNHRLKALPLL